MAENLTMLLVTTQMSGVNVFHSPEISRLMTTPVLLEQIETIQ